MKVWALYKEIFSNSPRADQVSLRLFMGITALTGASCFYLNYKGPIFWLVISIALNSLFIYWSIDWKKAPGFYFWLIPINFWIILLCDGFLVVEMIFNSHKPWQPILTSIVNLTCILVFRKIIFNYGRSIRDRNFSKSTNKT